MTDRELLELAAKAAGIEISEWVDGEPMKREGDAYWMWNPLADDCDALRLAVLLGIDPMFNVFDSENRRCVSCTYPVPRDYLSVTEPYGDDPYAATRRAIVRAAAEIGKESK